MENEKTKGLPNVKTDRSISGGSGESSAAASESSPSAPDHSGKVMGGYQLVRMIAEGGMGVVYEAIQLNLSRRVAVKILSDELAARPEFVHRFQREVARRNFLQLSTTP
jgi:serine/threonine protein kinase